MRVELIPWDRWTRVGPWNEHQKCLALPSPIPSPETAAVMCCPRGTFLSRNSWLFSESGLLTHCRPHPARQHLLNLFGFLEDKPD